VTNGLEVVHGVEVAHDVPATSGLDVAYGVEVAGATAEERLADLQRSYDALARHAASLLNSATDAFVSMDRHGSVVGWNAQAERLFGWSAAEANGRDLADLLIPEELRHSHRAGLRRLVAGGSSALLGRVVEVEGLHRDGRRIPLQLTVWPTPLGDDTRFSAFLRDVSDRTAAGAALAASEQRFRTAFDTGPVAMAIADEDDRWVEVNPAFCALLGRSAPDLLGRRLVEMAHPDDVELAGAVQRRRRREGNSPSRGEIRLVRGDSSIAWAVMSTAKLPGPSGEDDWTLTHLHDVSERKQAEIELARRATHDDLTGLPNRVLLLEKITAALGSARRSGRPGAVLFCDLDGFKLINDSRGHPVGDAVLQLVSRRLESVVRADDVVARLGGDEFVVLARDVTVHEATSLAQRVLDTLSQPVTAGGHDVFVTTSVGIATYDAGTALGIDAHDMLRDADSAMYAAKDSGRNQAVVFGAHLRRTAIRRSRAEQRLRSALSRAASRCTTSR
jgi:diguanylate cyclase (GGDEF)-like protein/PAS domain S-box-containing protein